MQFDNVLETKAGKASDALLRIHSKLKQMLVEQPLPPRDARAEQKVAKLLDKLEIEANLVRTLPSRSTRDAERARNK